MPTSTKPKEDLINPMIEDLSNKRLNGKTFLSADIKGNKNVNLGIQLEEIYSVPHLELLSRICEFSNLSEDEASSYLDLVVNVIPKDSID